VNIVRFVVGQGVVDHEGQAPDVDTPGRHICADQKPRLRKQSDQSESAAAKKRPIKKRSTEIYLVCDASNKKARLYGYLLTRNKSVRAFYQKACLNKQGSIRKRLRQQRYQYLIITRWACSKKAANKKACLQTLGPIRKHLCQESKNLIGPSCGFPKTAPN
jgi:hypothetical protein